MREWKKKGGGHNRKAPGKTQNRGKTKRDRTRENFGPSTSSTSFYHHRLHLERRILDRETGEEPQNRGRLEEEKNRLSFLCFFSRKQRRLKEKATGRRDREEGSNTERKKKNVEEGAEERK